MTLADALASGCIDANITGRYSLSAMSGVSAGDSIIVNILRKVNYTIEIENIPTGTLLTSSGNTQAMAILDLRGKNMMLNSFTPVNAIILDTSTWQDYVFSAYCVNIHGSIPSSSTIFQISGMADQNIQKIYSSLDKHPSSNSEVAALQTAIYVVTDNVSTSQLQNLFPSGVAEIQNAKAILDKAGIDTSKAALFT
jgi:hypothetical protein